VLITLAYGGLVIPLNMLFGWNYGYAGQSTPDNPTLLDKLGPWPLRLVWMTGIVSVFFVAATAIARALFKDDPAAPVTRHSRR
jgi:uncharacterized membrane protein YwaF